LPARADVVDEVGREKILPNVEAGVETRAGDQQQFQRSRG